MKSSACLACESQKNSNSVSTMKMVEMGKNYNFSLNYKSDFLRLGSNMSTESPPGCNPQVVSIFEVAPILGGKSLY